MDKKDFIKFISSVSIDEINEFIKQNGKEPKYIVPARFVKNNK